MEKVQQKTKTKNCLPWAWLHMPLIPTLGRQSSAGGSLWTVGQPGLHGEF